MHQNNHSTHSLVVGYLAWIFGIHRMYMGKWLTGLLYLLTCGLFLVGYLYDLWTLNDQVSQANAENT